MTQTSDHVTFYCTALQRDITLKKPSDVSDYAGECLQAAHDACLNHPERPVLGMSHGPFAGVNQVLGLIRRGEALYFKALLDEQKLRQKSKPEGAEAHDQNPR